MPQHQATAMRIMGVQDIQVSETWWGLGLPLTLLR